MSYLAAVADSLKIGAFTGLLVGMVALIHAQLRLSARIERLEREAIRRCSSHE